MNEIALLESLWAPEDGFFWKIRQGIFVVDEFERTIETVASIRVPEGGVLSRRLVSLVWYIPLFMTWQTERVRERGGDVAVFDNATDRMTGVAEGILGIP